jgi:riboflavin kinase/FMN adenylyltransferase
MAAAQLGRPHSIRSSVVHGEQRGRELGYPTANLSPELEGFIPRDGVYAAWATVPAGHPDAAGATVPAGRPDGAGATVPAGRFGAAVSIGNNPTFDGVPQKQVEAHLLDAKLDLYGQTIELEFVDYIRPMERFESAATLAAQMRVDEEQIRSVLASAGERGTASPA